MPDEGGREGEGQLRYEVLAVAKELFSLFFFFLRNPRC